MNRTSTLKNAWLAMLLLSACNSQIDSKAPTPGPAQQNGDNNRTMPPVQLNDQYGQAGSLDHTIFVAIGGWNSCVQDPRIPQAPSPYGMNMNKEFSQYIKHIQERNPNVPVKSVIVCHGPNATEEARYVLSSQPNQMRTSDHQALYAAIFDFARTTGSDLVLLGHSYGGDFVMQTVQTAPADIKIRYLVTIDPISIVTCPPPVMMKLITTRATQFFGKNDATSNQGLGCIQSPRQYTPAQKVQMRSRVGWWQNYYQEDLLSILKSDPVIEGCNQRVRHHSLSMFLNGHIAMGMYQSLWADILTLTTNAVPNQCTDREI